MADRITITGDATTKIAAVTVDAKLARVAPTGPYGLNGTVVVSKGAGSLTIVYTNVTAFSVTNPAPIQAQLEEGASALSNVAVSSGGSNVGPINPGGLLGGGESRSEPLSDPDAGGSGIAEAGPGDDEESATEQIIRRLLESDDFKLEDIADFDLSTQAGIDALVEALDDLDETPGNVSYNATTGVFDVRVVREIDGMTDLDLDALGGSFTLNGEIEVSAMVDLHLLFGVDGTGFFVMAGSAADPQLKLTEIAVEGDLEAVGDLGIITIKALNPELEIDPDVQLSIFLRGPPDGKIRLETLLADPLSLIGIMLQGGDTSDATPDLSFTFDAEISSIFGSIPTQTFTLSWNDITDFGAIGISGPGMAYIQSKIDELKHSIEDGVQKLDDLLADLSSDPILNAELPIVGKKLTEVIDIGALRQVATAVTDYLDTFDLTSDTPTALPTIRGLLDALNTALNTALQEALDGAPVTLTISGALDTESPAIRFDIALDLSKTIHTGVDLGSGLAALGLDPELGGSLDLSLTVGISLSFSFGIDLGSMITGHAPTADDFFIRVHKAEASVVADLDINGIQIDMDLGAASGTLSIDGGHIRLDGKVNLGITDPNADGKLTFAELADIGSLLQLEPHATLEVTLPISGTLTGPTSSSAGRSRSS